GEPDEVHEKHGHDLALFLEWRRTSRGERRAAGQAEARDLGVLLPAPLAASLRHGKSLAAEGKTEPDRQTRIASRPGVRGAFVRPTRTPVHVLVRRSS